MSSLIEIVRKRFLDAIRSVNPAGRWKIVVVDEHSQKLLGATLKMFDILQENVTQVDAINSNRTLQPNLEAMYLVMPTTQNVERIINDFSSGKQQYAAAHLFFIEGLPEPLFQRLTASAAEPFLRQLVELSINFWPLEKQVLSLEHPDFFFSFFSPPPSQALFQAAYERFEDDLWFTSRCIVNACIQLEEFPLIRYHQPSTHGGLGPLKPPEPVVPESTSSSRWKGARQAQPQAEVVDDHISKRLAYMVQDALDEYRRTNPEFPKSANAPRPRGVLFITDRTMDLYAPLLHEFTYQAMAVDLLPIEDGTKYRYKFQSSIGASEDKIATLSDADQVWTQVRHMHMREAIDKLMEDFNKFLEEHAGFKEGSGATSLNDMKDMLASLPQYQEQRERFSTHLNIAQECMALFERKKLPLTANVEQCCATGLNTDGKSPKTLVEEMVPLLDDRYVSNRDKVRIIALYILYRDGVADEDRRRLFQHARLTMAEQDAVNSLVHLGARILRGANDGNRKRSKVKTSDDEQYELSRYRPVLKTVLEDHFANKLEMTFFPYVRDAPVTTIQASQLRSPANPTSAASLRSAKPNWARAQRAGAPVAEIRQRALVFIAGGMTYSEMRTVYEVSAALGKDIFIGSTHVFSPEQFVDDMKVIEIGGKGSAELPQGLQLQPSPPNHHRSYQASYDRRYWIRDAPAATRPSSSNLTPRSKARVLSSSSIPSREATPEPTALTPPPSSISSRLQKEKKEDRKDGKKKGFFHF
ncbi:Sec1-like protein [Dacryopinax primogenitus]|uniref:Sec1-like protein n=1 Tax=Dacryopinax primogenitus (strain DJM 731) TaxID=1858805 RepID=M5GEW2_DACPD|nr:Sec1-like protein [Dacryopinax primogenitus]EJU03633.1 Sec1-like protein [Dacryopinax primogenitus]